MTSAQIRQSFLDFFKSKGHTIVPSSSLLPDSPNLLFTNAGMNQFVPIFLGQRAPDVSKWPGAIPGKDTRAADTQKCIRAGGKHNDLEDVGLDTYHHTFFEMLGNWSFGDYFKREAIEWAWELITEVWKFPKSRLYATVYSPDKSKGDPSDFDQEAYDFWAEKFSAAGLDPKVHIVYGNKKDNFWMMGDTGPCGPCSEIHFDLTPQGDSQGRLVNQGSAQCIEIWNLVFIQFNANSDGTFSPLPAKHVDTGMGFERVTSFIQCTKGFTDFTRVISNYETDTFRPIFDKIEKLSGKKYGSTLPSAGTTGTTEQEKIDIAFRVIADHIRALSLAIADGIEPGNKERNAVLRRILRRAAMFGRALRFHEPFLYKLVSIVADNMSHVFPQIRESQEHVEKVIQREEEAFNKTLDTGLAVFEKIAAAHKAFGSAPRSMSPRLTELKRAVSNLSKPDFEREKRNCYREAAALDRIALPLRMQHDLELLPREFRILSTAPAQIESDVSMLESEPIALPLERDRIRLIIEKGIKPLDSAVSSIEASAKMFSGESAFLLSATYGLPVEETERLAREHGLALNREEYKRESEEHQALSRAAQKKQAVEVSKIDPNRPTKFLGYETLSVLTRTAGIVAIFETEATRKSLMTEATPFYAEMGGQVGDSGTISTGDKVWHVINTLRSGPAFTHVLSDADQEYDLLNELGQEVEMTVDRPRRSAIQRHHTVTHLLHWALHEVVSKDASQKGSYVGPEKLTFDFNCAPLSPQQVADVEKLVNERILENAGVSWTEVPYAEVKSRKDVMQFFGDKYGDVVRVVQIGGRTGELNGYSMELCGGTHTRATGEIGLFRIVGESAIAAGVRRIEAVAGLEAYKQAHDQWQLIKVISGKINSPLGEIEKKIESLLAQQKDLEKQLKAANQKQATDIARGLIAKAQTFGSTPAIIENLAPADGDFLQSIADALKGQFKGVVVLGGSSNGAVSLIATVSPELTKQIQAGKIIQTIAPIVGGKGGGKPDNARGGGKEVAKLEEALAQARKLLT